MALETEAQVRLRLSNQFPYFAKACLRIRPKEGSIVPLVLNREQLYVHSQVEEQRKRIGRVRALVLKGRQQGMSTYVEARAYWRTIHSQGYRAFILTHHADATSNLFNMAKRYHEYMPPGFRPEVGTSSQKELAFPALDSGYKVGTAGTEGTGRSDTIQYFHGSEVAFWPDADSHMAGALQAVPDANGTEVWLESTANGIGNVFHQKWQEAEAGLSDYLPLFIPWYWNVGYRREVPEGFTLSDEDVEYQEMWGLSLEQMAWRQRKMRDLGADWLFCQEYPACPAEAFQNSGQESYIPGRLVMQARRCEDAEPHGALVVGLDPAYTGEDRTVFCFRQGRKVIKLDKYMHKDTMEVAGLAVQILRDTDCARMFIDIGGVGAGVVDRLRELGYGHRITAVNFGEKPIDGTKYLNKRAEMYGLLKEALEEQPFSIPDDDELHADLIGPMFSYDSLTRLKLESKADMKKRKVRSPDMADALVLTFAYPVHVPDDKPKRYRGSGNGPGWMAA